jgi:hypothetical protein
MKEPAILWRPRRGIQMSYRYTPLHLLMPLPSHRIPHLKLAINNMVIAEIVTRYTLLDEVLSHIIAKYFFKPPKVNIHFGKLWRTKSPSGKKGITVRRLRQGAGA